MNKIKLIGIFCIFLIVSLPIAAAETINPSANQIFSTDKSGAPLPQGYYRNGDIIYGPSNTIVSYNGYYQPSNVYNQPNSPGAINYYNTPTNLDPRNYPSGVNDPNYIRAYYQTYSAYPPGYSVSNQPSSYQYPQQYGNQPGVNPYSSTPPNYNYPSSNYQFNTGPSFIPSYMDRSGNLLQGYTRDSNTGEIKDPNGRVIATKDEADRIGSSLRVGAGEINFNYIGPGNTGGLSLGTTTGNILLNVNRYEPTVLTTNLIEEQSVPVYAFLSGSIATAPGIAPKISYMDVNVIGGDVQYVAGKPRFNPPIAYTLEDLGYVETWLTRIPKESQVPNKIDLTLQARVQFEGDSTVPIFGGEERKILQENRKRDIFIRGGFADQDLRIFGGRAYLKAKYIADNRVSFDVYTGDGVYIGELSASPGQETYPISIVPGSNFIGDQLRVRVERIFGGNQDSVKFINIKGKDYVYNRGQEIQVEKEVPGGDKRIRPTGWTVQDIFVSGSTGMGGGTNTGVPNVPSSPSGGGGLDRENQLSAVNNLLDGSIIQDALNTFYKRKDGKWYLVPEPLATITDRAQAVDVSSFRFPVNIIIRGEVIGAGVTTRPTTRPTDTQPATRQADSQPVIRQADSQFAFRQELSKKQLDELPIGSLVFSDTYDYWFYKMDDGLHIYRRGLPSITIDEIWTHKPIRFLSLLGEEAREDVRRNLEVSREDLRPAPPNLGYGFLVLKQGALLPNYGSYGSANFIPSFGGVIPNVGTGYSGSSYGQGDELLLVYDITGGLSLDEARLVDWYTKILSDNSALNDLKGCSNFNSLVKFGITDAASCRFVGQRILNLKEKYPNNDEIIRKIKELINTVKVDFDIGDLPKFVLEKGAGIKASLRVGGSVIPFAEGDPIQNTQSCVDRDKKDTSCRVRSIQDDRVTITHYEQSPYSGGCVPFDETLYLNANTLGQRFDAYTNPLGGSYNIQPVPGVNYQTGTNKCGGYIELTEISSGRSVEVTVLAGPPRGYAEAVFNLHIPIEKRAINLSVDKLDEQINSTKKMIESLTKVIDKLEKFVSVWMKICLAISAWFTIEAFLVGLPKYNKDTSGGPQASYESEFKSSKEGGMDFYDSYTLKPQIVQKPATQPAQGVALPPSGPTGTPGNKIDGIDEGGFYYYERDSSGNIKKDSKTGLSNKIPLKDVGVLYDNQGKQYEYDYFKKQMVPVTSIKGSENNQVQVFTGGDGKKRIIVTTDSLDDTSSCLRQYSGSRPTQLEQYKKRYGDKGYYFVFEEGEALQLWHKSGENIDFNTLQVGQNELRDQLVTEYPKTGAGALGSIAYRGAEQNLGVIKDAQIRGQSRAVFCGKPYQINDRGRLDKTKAKCEDILGEGKCKLLFNACDPVVCPRSRCNLGGQYYATGPGGVIGSGLVGSLLLCLPNIQQGVIVPICLSGILASLKGIRSHLQSYVKCLEAARTGQVSVGVCDKIRSIFICEFIWKEGLMLLNAKAGLINMANTQAGGGGEYFTQGVGGSVQEANEVVSFIVNDYADDVLAAYKGKGLPEIGAEICKASIAQRIPFMDALLGDAATPPDPPQFTANFEETPYAPTLGKSKYQVYFHVYAGTPQREQGLNWMVYLKSFGSSPILRVGAGSLPPGESADETIDVIGDKGYQQICVVLNGVEQCGFGKTVSSDFFLNTLNDYITSQELGANIQTAAQCKSDPTSVVSTVGNRGILPGGPSVRRGCFASNPGIGIGEEKFWRKVGSCGSDKQSVSLGDCYEFADWQRYPQIENQVLGLSCGANNVCKPTQECKGGQITNSFTTSSGEFCCDGGSCVDKAYVGEINSMATSLTSGLSQSDKVALDDTIRRDWQGGDVRPAGAVGSPGRSFFIGNNPKEDEARLYIASKICISEVTPGYIGATVSVSNECLSTIQKINPSSPYYAPAHYMLAVIYDKEGSLQKAREEYENSIKTGINPEMIRDKINDINNRIKEIKKELDKRPQEEKNKVDVQNRINKAKILSEELNRLISLYSGFSTVTDKLKSTQQQFTSIILNQVEAAQMSSSYNTAVENAIKSINEINILNDNKYKEIVDNLNTIKSLMEQSKYEDGARGIDELKVKLNGFSEIQIKLNEIAVNLRSTLDKDKGKTSVNSLISNDLLNMLQKPLLELNSRIAELKVSLSQQSPSPSTRSA